MIRVVVVAILTWLALQVVVGVLVGLDPASGHDIVVLGITHALVLGGATFVATSRQDHRALLSGFGWHNVAYGLALGVCLKLPMDGIRVLVEHYHPTDPEVLRQQELLLRHDTWPRVVALFFVLGGSGPLAEELFYRGYVFRALRQVSSRVSTIAWCTLLFVVAHPSVSDWPSLVLVGGVLSALRAFDGNLWSALGAHAALNSATVLAVVVGLQGPEVGGEFPVAAALVSASLAAALLTVRFKRT